MRKYELMVILKPLLSDSDRKKAVGKVQKLAKKLGGSLGLKEDMGKRLFAYPIGSFKEGYYYVFDLGLEVESISEFQTDLNHLNEVIRFLMIKEEDI